MCVMHAENIHQWTIYGVKTKNGKLQCPDDLFLNYNVPLNLFIPKTLRCDRVCGF